jgi:hypothetical protein
MKTSEENIIEIEIAMDNTTAQTTQILDWLQSGHSITPLEALTRFNCLRLGARIWDLKNEGYNIQSELVKDPETGKRYCEYRIANGGKL